MMSRKEDMTLDTVAKRPQGKGRKFWTVFGAVMLTSSLVWAAGKIHTVKQAGKTFSVTELSVAAGDTIKVVNNDTVTHNLFVREGGYNLNELQKPGQESTFLMDKKGKITLRCAIHPKMSLKVQIE